MHSEAELYLSNPVNWLKNINGKWPLLKFIMNYKFTPPFFPVSLNTLKKVPWRTPNCYTVKPVVPTLPRYLILCLISRNLWPHDITSNHKFCYLRASSHLQEHFIISFLPPTLSVSNLISYEPPSCFIASRYMRSLFPPLLLIFPVLPGHQPSRWKGKYYPSTDSKDLLPM